MRMSQLLGQRYKERPVDAAWESHAFLLRGAYMRLQTHGVYTFLPPAIRVLQRIEGIIREEMIAVGGQEVCLSPIMDEEGLRQPSDGASFRFQDRGAHALVLKDSHEEAFVRLCRHEINSYTQLPLMVYQFQRAFRDEAHCRGGLLVTRERSMKEACSFHDSQADLDHYYMRCYQAYQRVFSRIGIAEVVPALAAPGIKEGDAAHAFIFLTESGEDAIVSCDQCGYLAKQEAATGRITSYPEDPLPLEKVHTPSKKTIEEVSEFLGVPTKKTAKVVFYESPASDQLTVVLIRGDIEVNETKLAKVTQRFLIPAVDEKIDAIGAVPGFASPLGLDPRACRIVVDASIAASGNLICGANEPDYHYLNFNLARDLPEAEVVDAALIREGDGCPLCSAALQLKRGIELARIFQVGDVYTKALIMNYHDAAGVLRAPLMGSYRIEINRVFMAVIEARHDRYGPKWPLPVAPWQVHLCALKMKNDVVKEAVERLYEHLKRAGIEVLFDDRDERPGVQFAEADLLGIPIRLIVSEKGLNNREIEYKRRDRDESGLISLEQSITMVLKWIHESDDEDEEKDVS